MPKEHTEATANAEETLERTKNIRRAHRGQVTKLIAKTEAILYGESHNEQDIDILQSTIENIEKKLELLQTLDNTILELVEAGRIETVISEADDYTTSVTDRLVTYKRQLNTHKTAQSPPSNVSATPHVHSKKNVTLPKLVLPVFEGDILKWSEFHDAFMSAVHGDGSLENIHKFQYLKAHVSGEAARCIDGLQLSNDNYNEALTLLQDKYGKEHKVIAAYMKALWELPKPNNDISSMNSFYDKLETYTRGLRSLGKSEDSYGDLLVPIILEKLHSQIKLHMAREHGDAAWSLDQLKKAIYKEIQATEASKEIHNIEDRYEETQASAAAFHVNAKRDHAKKDRVITCAYCEGSHSSVDCVKVRDKEKRNVIVRKNRLCYNCLRSNHAVRDCKSKNRCRLCKRKHHTSLCDSENAQQHVQSQDRRNEHTQGRRDNDETHVKLTPTGTGPVLLKTAEGTVTSMDNRHSTSVNILLDEGAQRTFITENTVKQLNITSTRRETINLATFGTNTSGLRHMDVVDINLQTTSGQQVMLSALVVPQISTPVNNLVPATVLNYPYLQSVPLAKHSDSRTFNIDLLIGADYYWSIIEDTIVRGDGPTAVLSKLGFLLSGPTHLKVSTMSTFVYKVLTSTESDLQRVSEYWMLESLGITDREDTQVDRDFETYRDNNITMSEGKYNASLPWKDEHPALPTNVDIANKRTRAMVKRLTPELRQTYNRIIEEQETLQFIERVHNDDGQGHYIPHHAVAKDSDTTPIRIVFHCSCKTKDQPSLNDCLETGPKLTNDMLEILLRFRIHKVAVTSDIEKAFLNVKLHEKDRNFTKFFWLSDPSNSESDFVVYRFASVLFGSVSSPFILNAVLKTHLENSPSSAAQDLLQNTYVDNLVSGKDDLNAAILYYEDAVNTLAQAGFKLRSWTSNNSQLREKFKQDNIQHDKPTTGVLGMNWKTDTDTLSYKPQIKRDAAVYTKREVIKTTASFFDPLGFLLPVHVGAKIFIQKLWRENLDWDQPLPDELATEWTSIREELYFTSQIRMKRQYTCKSDRENSELHVFADASSRAYGVVIYLKSGRDISFVVAKAKVKPLKDITLPRLELLAAFIAAKLATFVKSAFSQTSVNITKVVLWSDSQVVLHWIHGNKKLPTFVENRVRFIKAAGFDDIKYCSSKDNPADLITRGVTYKEFTH